MTACKWCGRDTDDPSRVCIECVLNPKCPGCGFIQCRCRD